MPSTDQIPVYLEGDAVGIARPLKIIQRAEARQLKKERKGYFVSHGQVFMLYREAAAETALQDDHIRDTRKTYDESASIQPPTMDHYVEGRRRARDAVDFWNPVSVFKRMWDVDDDGEAGWGEVVVGEYRKSEG